MWSLTSNEHGYCYHRAEVLNYRTGRFLDPEESEVVVPIPVSCSVGESLSPWKSTETVINMRLISYTLKFSLWFQIEFMKGHNSSPSRAESFER